MRIKRLTRYIMAVLATSFPLVAMAHGAAVENPSSLGVDAGTITTQQIDSLNSRIAVLEAELKIAKLKASIKKARSTKNSSTGLTGSVEPNPMPSPYVNGYGRFNQHKPGSAMPRIESIIGANGHLSATVSMPNGGQRIVGNGSKLSNGITVLKITPSGVEVSDKNGIQWLSFMNGNSDESGTKDSGQSTPFSNSMSPPPFTPPSMTSLPTPPRMGSSPQSGPSPYAGMTGGN